MAAASKFTMKQLDLIEQAFKDGLWNQFGSVKT